MTAALTEAAPAKVNLFLHVTGRRADGLHLLDSLVVFAEIGDSLALTPAPALRLAVEGPEARALAAEPDNLVLRAARALAEASARPAAVALTLTKRLPVASGIGGGSADAAATLRLLARHWGIVVPPELAPRLGADVTACLLSRALRFGGIGEVISPAPSLPRLGLVLCNPRLPLATAAVFSASRPRASTPAVLPPAWASAAAMAGDLAQATRNDLEAAAIGLCPPIAEVLTALTTLPGCLLARMSGSGATCFGLFESPAEAAAAAARLRPGWWAWGGGLHPDVPAG